MLSLLRWGNWKSLLPSSVSKMHWQTIWCVKKILLSFFGSYRVHAVFTWSTRPSISRAGGSSHCNDCRDRKKPRSRTFVSGELGGWCLISNLNRLSCSFAWSQTGSWWRAWVFGLSCCIRFLCVLQDRSRGHLAITAGITLLTMKSM